MVSRENFDMNYLIADEETQLNIHVKMEHSHPFCEEIKLESGSEFSSGLDTSYRYQETSVRMEQAEALQSTSNSNIDTKEIVQESIAGCFYDYNGSPNNHVPQTVAPKSNSQQPKKTTKKFKAPNKKLQKTSRSKPQAVYKKPLKANNNVPQTMAPKSNSKKPKKCKAPIKKVQKTSQSKPQAVYKKPLKANNNVPQTMAPKSNSKKPKKCKAPIKKVQKTSQSKPQAVHKEPLKTTKKNKLVHTITNGIPNITSDFLKNKRKKDNNKNLLRSMRNQLVCRYCNRWSASDELLTCNCGIWGCASCYQEATLCVICHLQPTKHLGAIQIHRRMAALIPHPCYHQGCQHIIQPGEDHQENCRFKPFPCYQCKQPVSVGDVISHFQSAHPKHMPLGPSKENVTFQDFWLNPETKRLMTCCFVEDREVLIIVESKTNEHTNCEVASFNFKQRYSGDSRNVIISFTFEFKAMGFYSYSKTCTLDEHGIGTIDLDLPVFNHWVKDNNVFKFKSKIKERESGTKSSTNGGSNAKKKKN